MTDDSKKSLFERFTQLIVPLVATITAFLQQKQRAVALSLISLAIVSLLVSEVPKLQKWLAVRRHRKQERLQATAALEELRRWIHKFLEFSNTTNSDTLYNLILTVLCQSHDGRFGALRLAPGQLYADFARILAERTDERKPSLAVLRQSIEEFNSLVGLFCRYFVCPVYEKVPQFLTPETLETYKMYKLEKPLVQFRERYDRFLEGYMDYLKNLDRIMPTSLGPNRFGYYFERPKPVEAPPY